MEKRQRITPDLSKVTFVDLPAALVAEHSGWKQPEAECTHCGEKHDDLRPMTVAGHEVVLDEKLCPSCREALADADDFLEL